MNDTPRSETRRPLPLVWDWPLRIWHWAFAMTITGSLVTGWLGEIALMDWHLRLGYLALGLLLFRIGWAIWGSRYARLTAFRPSPRRLLAHLRGRGTADPRTAPGAALGLLLVALVALQATSGLFTSDEIFTEGPLVRHASDDLVEAMSALHHRVFWGVGALVGLHLLAHLIYALCRDPTPLSMFTGRKPAEVVEGIRHLPVRALLTAAAAGIAVWLGLWIA